MSSKLQTYLGFAAKSRSLVSGYDTCLNLIKRKKIKLILITKDASENTIDRFKGLTENNGVPMYEIDRNVIAGKLPDSLEGRNIFGITDINFAKAMTKEIESMRK